jgi:hypothetical protein
MHKIEVNVATGEVKEIQLTESEIAARDLAFQQEQADHLAAIEKAAQLAADKAALLDRLGITENEAKLLLS